MFGARAGFVKETVAFEQITHDQVLGEHKIFAIYFRKIAFYISATQIGVQFHGHRPKPHGFADSICFLKRDAHKRRQAGDRIPAGIGCFISFCYFPLELGQVGLRNTFSGAARQYGGGAVQRAHRISLLLFLQYEGLTFSLV